MKNILSIRKRTLAFILAACVLFAAIYVPVKIFNAKAEGEEANPTEVGTYDELIEALADDSINEIKLSGIIAINTETATGSVTIEASEGRHVTITADSFYGNAFSIKDIDVTFNNLTITNSISRMSGGGAIYIQNSNLTLNDCNFIDNSAAKGGAIYTYNLGTNKTVTINGGSFENNTAFGFYNLSDNTPSGAEKASAGGAIRVDCPMTITNCDFIGNASDNTSSDRAYGGAVYAAYTKDISLTNCTFSGNYCKSDTSSARGGALHGGNYTIIGCEFDANHCNTNADGAAIYSESTVNISGSSSFTNNYITPNTMNGGGAIYVFPIGNLTTENTTVFSGNKIIDASGNLMVASDANSLATTKPNIKWAGNNSILNTYLVNEYDVAYSNQNSHTPYTLTFYADNTFSGDPLYTHLIKPNTTIPENLDVLTNSEAWFNAADDTEWNIAEDEVKANLTLYAGEAQNGEEEEEEEEEETPASIETWADLAAAVAAATGDATITLTQNILIKDEHTRVEIKYPITSLTIEGNGAVLDCEEQQSAFYIEPRNSLQAIPLTLKNLTIKNSKADKEGAVYVVRGPCNITAINCKFIDNEVLNGLGGVIVTNGKVIVENCEFTGNAAKNGGGGAIAADDVSATDCEFTDNKAKVGGAISSGPVTAVNCTFTNNRALHDSTGNGGGAIRTSGGSFDLTDCKFYNNSSVRTGGAITAVYYGGTITNCEFDGNTAVTAGGAVYTENDGTSSTSLTISGSSFTNNSLSKDAYPANSEGGAVYACKIDSITDTTFSGNRIYVAGELFKAAGGNIESLELEYSILNTHMYNSYDICKFNSTYIRLQYVPKTIEFLDSPNGNRIDGTIEYLIKPDTKIPTSIVPPAGEGKVWLVDADTAWDFAATKVTTNVQLYAGVLGGEEEEENNGGSGNEVPETTTTPSTTQSTTTTTTTVADTTQPTSPTTEPTTAPTSPTTPPTTAQPSTEPTTEPTESTTESTTPVATTPSDTTTTTTASNNDTTTSTTTPKPTTPYVPPYNPPTNAPTTEPTTEKTTQSTTEKTTQSTTESTTAKTTNNTTTTSKSSNNNTTTTARPNIIAPTSKNNQGSIKETEKSTTKTAETQSTAVNQTTQEVTQATEVTEINEVKTESKTAEIIEQVEKEMTAKSTTNAPIIAAVTETATIALIEEQFEDMFDLPDGAVPLAGGGFAIEVEPNLWHIFDDDGTHLGHHLGDIEEFDGNPIPLANAQLRQGDADTDTAGQSQVKVKENPKTGDNMAIIIIIAAICAGATVVVAKSRKN